jgi:hypothetical protein
MGYNWESFTTTSPSAEIANVVAGDYEIEVVAINALGVRSNTTSLTQSISTATTVPPDVTGVTITPLDQATGLLTWDIAADASVLVGGRVLVRHQPVMTGATWETSSQLVPNVAGTQSAAVVPLLEGTYLLKFSTSGGIRSSAAAATVVDLPAPHPRLLVQLIQEDATGYLGTFNGMYYSAERGGLSIDGGTLFDTLAPDGDFDALATLDSIGGVTPGGEYQFSAFVEMSAVYDVNLTRRLTVFPFNVAELFDENLGDIDTWGDFDGTDVTDSNAALYVRSTPDDPSGSPTWSEWRICNNNLLRGRGFQFKVVATSEQISQNVVVNELGAVVELQQRAERSIQLTSGVGAYVATFTNAFYDVPAVSITPLNMATGDYFTLSSVTATGFQVAFFNSGGSPVSRQFTYTAVGYGRRI